MPAIVSMLRGINLAAHHRVKMEDLRAVYESIGLKNPRTFIQSGNVVFQSNARNLAPLASRIENAIEQKFGFHATAVLRTTGDLRAVVAANPFATRSGIEFNKLLVTFLASEPSSEALAKARAIPAEPEEFHIIGREHYVYFPNGSSQAKLSMAAVDRALKVSGTGRNWNSVLKLLEMAEETSG